MRPVEPFTFQWISEGGGSLPTRPKEPQFRAHLPPPLCIPEGSRGALAPEASGRPAQGTVSSPPLESGPPSPSWGASPRPAGARRRSGRPGGVRGAGDAAAPPSPGPRPPRPSSARAGGRDGGAASGLWPAPAAQPAPPGPAERSPRRSAPRPGPDFPSRPASRARAPPGRPPLCPPEPAEVAMRPARWLALGSLLALAGLLEGRLVGEEEAGFGECDRFFYAGTPPAGLAAEAHVKICQRFEGAERFATLYSLRDRIPVYSAFRAARPAAAGAEPRWLVEPQVSELCQSPGVGLAPDGGALGPPSRGSRREGTAPAPSGPGQEPRVSEPPAAPSVYAAVGTW